MCIIACLFRPGHVLPLVIAHLREEHRFRHFRGPGFHWPHMPDVIGGIDSRKGGSWLVYNRRKASVWCLINRRGTLGPRNGGTSRGLGLLKLANNDAIPNQALSASCRNSHLLLPAHALVFRFSRHGGQAWFRTPDTEQTITIKRPGLTLYGAEGWWTSPSPRVTLLHRIIKDYEPDSPRDNAWQAWENATVDHNIMPANGLGNNTCDQDGRLRETRVATVSVSIIALAATHNKSRLPVWRFWRHGVMRRFAYIDQHKKMTQQITATTHGLP